MLQMLRFDLDGTTEAMSGSTIAKSVTPPNGAHSHINGVSNGVMSRPAPSCQPNPTEHLQIIGCTTYPSQALQFMKSSRTRRHGHDGTEQPEPAKIRLKIVIIGAGLGGLSAAIALARRGHWVSVLEQAPRLGEVCQG